MRIISLVSENLKRIKAIDLHPGKHSNIIGGKNNQGKSSLLDSIAYTLGGKRLVPDKPIRKGAASAKVTIDLGEMIVTRTFNDRGSEIRIDTKDGYTAKSPQKMMDELLGPLSLDPLAFCNMEAREQVEMLKEMLKLDFSNLEAEYAQAFEQRREAKRDLKSMEHRLKGKIVMPGLPDKELSAEDVASKLAQARESEAEKVRLENWQQDCSRRIKDKRDQVAKLQSEIAQLDENLKDATEKLKTIPELDILAIEKQLKDLSKQNDEIRENNTVRRLQAESEDLRVSVDSISARLEDILTEKRDAIMAAELPMEGLSFDEEGITYNDLPFEQLSWSERLRLSVAMGMAMNPKLRVILIREGSALDKDSLAMVRKMAEDKDYQMFIECVGEGGNGTIIIEDGMVKK